MAASTVSKNNFQLSVIQQPQNAAVPDTQGTHNRQQGRPNRSHSIALPPLPKLIENGNAAGGAQTRGETRFTLPSQKTAQMRYQASSANSKEKLRCKYESLRPLSERVQKNFSAKKTGPRQFFNLLQCIKEWHDIRARTRDKKGCPDLFAEIIAFQERWAPLLKCVAFKSPIKSNSVSLVSQSNRRTAG